MGKNKKKRPGSLKETEQRGYQGVSKEILLQSKTLTPKS